MLVLILLGGIQESTCADASGESWEARWIHRTDRPLLRLPSHCAPLRNLFFHQHIFLSSATLTRVDFQCWTLLPFAFSKLSQLFSFVFSFFTF